MPVLGVGGGSHNQRRGRVIRMLVESARDAVARHPIDIVISAINSSDTAAIHSYRRTEQSDRRYGFGAEAVERAHVARSEHLALFIGAGVRVPARSPSWDALLAKLAGDGSDAVRSLDEPVDQAEFLPKKLGHELGAKVAGLTLEARRGCRMRSWQVPVAVRL